MLLNRRRINYWAKVVAIVISSAFALSLVVPYLLFGQG